MLTLEQPTKAKRKILITLQSKKEPITEFDNTILCESTFSLLDIGEFDYASPYLEELKQRDISDLTTQAVIQKQTGDTLKSRIHTFKAENKAGIQAFAQKQYDQALTHFNQAVLLEPLNSGVLLNRLQVYIEQLKLIKKEDKNKLLAKCTKSIDLLSNNNLPKEHTKRYQELKNELTKIK